MTQLLKPDTSQLNLTLDLTLDSTIEEVIIKCGLQNSKTGDNKFSVLEFMKTEELLNFKQVISLVHHKFCYDNRLTLGTRIAFIRAVDEYEKRMKKQSAINIKKITDENKDRMLKLEVTWRIYNSQSKFIDTVSANFDGIILWNKPVRHCRIMTCAHSVSKAFFKKGNLYTLAKIQSCIPKTQQLITIIDVTNDFESLKPDIIDYHTSNDVAFLNLQYQRELGIINSVHFDDVSFFEEVYFLVFGKREMYVLPATVVEIGDDSFRIHTGKYSGKFGMIFSTQGFMVGMKFQQVNYTQSEKCLKISEKTMKNVIRFVDFQPKRKKKITDEKYLKALGCHKIFHQFNGFVPIVPSVKPPIEVGPILDCSVTDN